MVSALAAEPTASQEKGQSPLENAKTPEVHFCRLLPPYRRIRIPEGITELHAVEWAICLDLPY